MDTYHTKHTRRTLSTTLSQSQPPPSAETDLLILKPATLFIKIVAFQVEFISNCLLSLSSAFFSLLSMKSGSSHRADEATQTATAPVPSRVGEGGSLVLRKLGFGFLGAAYVCLILIAIMVLATLVAVGLIRLWVDEPVFVREPLHFDYTYVHPTAVFLFINNGVEGKKKRVIPIGHTYYVFLELVMPESDFNRQIGVFQLTAEAISTTGDILAKSSQSCMLRFRSLPIRLMRTFVMGIPILLGISGETQKITMGILQHKETNRRTEMIRIRMIPRAGTLSLPELYAAEIIINSQLPWKKELVHKWKWTFYVWTSLYLYIMLLVIFACCFRSFFFPTTMPMSNSHQSGKGQSMEEEEKNWQSRDRGDREVSESSRKWQRSRSKRKELFSHGIFSEAVGSSASSVTITREESEVVDDSGGLTDAESVCVGG